MPKGTVKWFNTQKGYGFIVPDGAGDDVFVHISKLESSGVQDGVQEGDRVVFDTAVNKRTGKPEAVMIKVVG